MTLKSSSLIALGLAAILALATPAMAKDKGVGGSNKSNDSSAASAVPETSEAPECGILPADTADLTCSCAADATPHAIWGSNPYTADSDICTAARHAGVIDAGGGLVHVLQTEGLEDYPGTSANGVEASAWGSYHTSITVMPAGEVTEAMPVDVASDLPECSYMPSDVDALDCACPANPAANGSSVWGSGPYTADSDICAAAMHAGVISTDGGAVHVELADGASEYPGGAAHGIETSDWGSYHTSINVMPTTGGAMVADASPEGAEMADSTEMTESTEMAEPAVPACALMPGNTDAYTCVCTADARPGSVWGVGPYSADSDICTAARHAGVIGAEGGGVLVNRLPGQESYSGGEANGVTTQPWSIYPSSIALSAAEIDMSAVATPDATDTASSGLESCGILPAGTERHSCSCSGDNSFGSVWGSGPYTADSDICQAALHDGVIGEAGGDVTVLRIQGLDNYAGTMANGVETSSWASDAASMVFDRN